MTTATTQGLAVSAIVELLTARGFRVTVTLDEAVVAERPEPAGRHVLRRVVAQENADGSLRVGYLFARPGKPGGPVYEHDLIGHEPVCRDITKLTRWLSEQDARAFSPKAGA